MRKETVVSAKTVEEAVAKAVEELGASCAQDIEYTVLEEPKKGLFGIGAVPAKISASYTVGGEYLALEFLKKLVADMALDLTVTEITNAVRTQITVCRIALSNIESSYDLNLSIPEHAKKVKLIQKETTSDGRKFFNYCPDINPTCLCILLVEECGEKFLLKLTPDATLWEYLKK